MSGLLNFPDEDSLAIVLEGGAGMGGIILEGETSVIDLGLLDDDDNMVSTFCCLCCCSGKLAAMCRRDRDEDGGPRLELGGVGVPQAALLGTFSEQKYDTMTIKYTGTIKFTNTI